MRYIINPIMIIVVMIIYFIILIVVNIITIIWKFKLIKGGLGDIRKIKENVFKDIEWFEFPIRLDS